MNDPLTGRKRNVSSRQSSGNRRAAVHSSVYADHASTSPLAPEAREAMLPLLQQNLGNPSSLHFEGMAVRKIVEQARSEIASLLHATPEEIFFTSGGTESDNWAIKGLAESRVSIGRHGIVSAIEHDAVLNTCAHLTDNGLEVTKLKVNGIGHVLPDTLRQAIRPDTAFVSVMLANNEVGTIQDIPVLAAIAHEHKIPFHTDAVQAVGHIPIDVHTLGCDLLSASAHKFNGPKGVGFLYIRHGVGIRPLLDGGSQERGIRAGTENVVGIAGMAAALKARYQQLEADMIRLKKLEAQLKEALAELGIPLIYHGDADHHLPGMISVSMPTLDVKDLLRYLSAEEIAISAGAACHALKNRSSHVLSALGVPPDIALQTIRISFGVGNTEKDAVRIVQAIRAFIQHTREVLL